jgi:DMSO/TMAO reductase YedYZ molybdopterin-dependent catalytic subunit
MGIDNKMTPPNKVSRRGFLLAVTGSAIAAAAGCRPDNIIPPTIYAPGSGPRATHTPAPTVNSPTTAVPDENWGALTYDKTVITPVDQLYITQYDYSRTPEVDPKEWVLVVDGLVENMGRFDLDMCTGYVQSVPSDYGNTHPGMYQQPARRRFDR